MDFIIPRRSDIGVGEIHRKAFSRTVSLARCASRDGSSPDPAAPSNRRYVEGQRLYLRNCQPEAKATLIVDYNDLSAPSLVI